MNSMHSRVVAVTIMYGDRWKFLSQVVEAAMKDPYIVHMVIVDNGATHKGQIQEGVRRYGDRVTVLETGKNLGSAGGLAVGLGHARELECDFVFILDDDSIPEEGAVVKFLDVLKLFPDKKVVLSANREDVLDNKEDFYKPPVVDDSPRGTFFEVFSWKKLGYFVALLIKGRRVLQRGPFIPVIPTEAFVSGGSFIPIDAVRKAPLPDASLFMYGEDVEYSWNIKKLGYTSYLCAHPILRDVDLTFGQNGSHIFGQFNPKTAPFKVYYRLRNMVRLSRKHSSQGEFLLLVNVLVWVLGLYVLGLIRVGPSKTYRNRVALLAKAVYAGYFPNSDIAKRVEASFFS